MLLSVLLTEMTVLYSRLANAFLLLRRERANRLMSVDAVTSAIAHAQLLQQNRVEGHFIQSVENFGGGAR